jgi:hypothetical protein
MTTIALMTQDRRYVGVVTLIDTATINGVKRKLYGWSVSDPNNYCASRTGKGNELDAVLVSAINAAKEFGAEALLLKVS